MERVAEHSWLGQAPTGHERIAADRRQLLIFFAIGAGAVEVAHETEAEQDTASGDPHPGTGLVLGRLIEQQRAGSGGAGQAAEQTAHVVGE